MFFVNKNDEAVGLHFLLFFDNRIIFNNVTLFGDFNLTYSKKKNLHHLLRYNYIFDKAGLMTLSHTKIFAILQSRRVTKY